MQTNALELDVSNPGLDHAPLPMVMVDGDQHIVRYVNPAFCRLLDKPADQLVGKPFCEMLSEQDDCVTLLDRVYRTGRSETHTAQHYSTPAPVFESYTAWPVMANERPVGVMIQVAETAEFHDRMRALNEALLLGSVRQHELAEAADSANALLQVEITERKRVEYEVRLLSGHLLQSQDEERGRIARELHDSTGQELVAVAVNLGLVQKRSTGRDVTADNLIADSQAILEQCQRELRTLAYQLHPPVLDDLGLVGAVQEYAAGFTQRSGIKVTLDARPALGRLPAETEQTLFRVVQENLSNVHRHSGSRIATIRIAREAAEVILEVSDQGHGLRLRADGTAANAGVGLAGMRERVRQLGGRFEIESSDQGTTVRVIVPDVAGATE